MLYTNIRNLIAKQALGNTIHTLHYTSLQKKKKNALLYSSKANMRLSAVWVIRINWGKFTVHPQKNKCIFEHIGRTVGLVCTDSLFLSRVHLVDLVDYQDLVEGPCVKM